MSHGLMDNEFYLKRGWNHLQKSTGYLRSPKYQASSIRSTFPIDTFTMTHDVS